MQLASFLLFDEAHPQRQQPGMLVTLRLDESSAQNLRLPAERNEEGAPVKEEFHLADL